MAWRGFCLLESYFRLRTDRCGREAWAVAFTSCFSVRLLRLGTFVGGRCAPLLFGVLIATNSRVNVSLGYALGAILMLGGAVCEHFFGVEAAGKGLESISKPLQSDA